ncbi:MAG: T9SS type A sorting domain-containing protein, partial [Crocinitomix sp.]|nr:T9SS type A sorting domain-containing protein [Crocinitomix sp.]
SDGEIDITVTGGIPPYSFDWDNDGTGDFDDTEDLTGLTAGTYVVMVKCDAGCVMNESITVNSQLGVDETNGLLVAVYPNPTNDVVNIQFEGAFTYELSAVNGELILKGSSVNKKELDLDQLSEGVYFVTITAEGKTSTVKLVKN